MSAATVLTPAAMATGWQHALNAEARIEQLPAGSAPPLRANGFPRVWKEFSAQYDVPIDRAFDYTMPLTWFVEEYELIEYEEEGNSAVTGKIPICNARIRSIPHSKPGHLLVTFLLDLPVVL